MPCVWVPYANQIEDDLLGKDNNFAIGLINELFDENEVTLSRKRKEYWKDKFSKHGLDIDGDMTHDGKYVEWEEK